MEIDDVVPADPVKLTWLSFILCWLALASCSTEPPPEEQEGPRASSDSLAQIDRGTAAAAPSAVIGDSSVGCLEVGAPLASVRSACGEVGDTTIHLEGDAYEAVWVEVDGGRALAEIVDGSVWRIRVTDPALRTADSISVGTPVKALADLPEVEIVHGEGRFARSSAHCGKSFQVAGLPVRAQSWSPADLRALPDSAEVIGILITGRC